MANLSSLLADGSLAWERIVGQNRDWSSTDLFEIDRDAVLYVTRRGRLEPEKELRSGTQVRIRSRSYFLVGRERYASVNHRGQSGYVLISRIRTPETRNTLQAEVVAMAALDRTIRAMRRPVTVLLRGRGKTSPFNNIRGVRNVPGTPKADFSLVDDRGREVLYVSHKNRGGPRAIQQYGGVSERSGSSIYEHDEVQDFMRAVASNIHRDRLDRSVWRRIRDRRLIGMSVFGPDFGAWFGHECVHVVGQGNPIVRPVDRSGDAFYLEFEEHTWVYPDLSGLTGRYEPVLAATYREGRGFTVDGQSYRGARIGVYPVEIVRRRDSVEV